MDLLGRYDRADMRSNMVHNGLGNRLDRHKVPQALKGLEHNEETDLAGHAQRQGGGECLLLRRGGIDLGEITRGDRCFQPGIRRIMDTGHGDLSSPHWRSDSNVCRGPRDLRPCQIGCPLIPSDVGVEKTGFDALEESATMSIRYLTGCSRVVAKAAV
jgi:hypothetical protein